MRKQYVQFDLKGNIVGRVWSDVAPSRVLQIAVDSELDTSDMVVDLSGNDPALVNANRIDSRD